MTTTMELRTTPIQSRSQKRLDQILEAGKRVLAEVGPLRLTTAMVADRAGCSIGTFYRYFVDNVALLERISADVVYYPRTITTLAQIEALPVNAVLMCSVNEVFHLHESDDGYPGWVAAGYPQVWSAEQVFVWAPLTWINAPAGDNTL